MQKSKSLYEITEKQLMLTNEIEKMDGELTPEMEEMLSINEKDLEVKSIAYLSLIKKNKSFNKDIEEEIKRLQSLKSKGVNLINRLENSLLSYIKINGSFKTKFNNFGTRKSTSVKITDEDQIPKFYFVSKTTSSPDKKKIKEALKEGLEIEGVQLSDNLNLKIN